MRAPRPTRWRRSTELIGHLLELASWSGVSEQRAAVGFTPVCLSNEPGDAARVRLIFEDTVATYTRLALILAGIVAMFMASDARVLIVVWAAGGIAAAVVADVKRRQRSRAG